MMGKTKRAKKTVKAIKKPAAKVARKKKKADPSFGE